MTTVVSAENCGRKWISDDFGRRRRWETRDVCLFVISEILLCARQYRYVSLGVNRPVIIRRSKRDGKDRSWRMAQSDERVDGSSKNDARKNVAIAEDLCKPATAKELSNTDHKFLRLKRRYERDYVKLLIRIETYLLVSIDQYSSEVCNFDFCRTLFAACVVKRYYTIR